MTVVGVPRVIWTSSSGSGRPSGALFVGAFAGNPSLQAARMRVDETNLVSTGAIEAVRALTPDDHKWLMSVALGIA